MPIKKRVRRKSTQCKVPDSLHCLTEQKLAHIQGETYTRDGKIILEAAAELLEVSSEEDVYCTISNHVKAAVGDTYVLANRYDEKTTETEVMCFQCPDESIILKIIEILGRSPVGMRTFIPEGVRLEMLEQKLMPGPVGISELSMGTVPKHVGAMLDRLLGIGETYGVGFSWEGQAYGNLIILSTKENDSFNHRTVETLAYLGSIALQRMRAEENLPPSEEYFCSLIETSSDAFLVVDEDFVVQYASSSSYRIFGHGVHETRNPSLTNLILNNIPPDSADMVMEKFEECKRRSDEETRCKIRFKHSDGSWHHIVMLLRNCIELPAIGGIVVNLRDITEQKRTSIILRETQGRYKHLAESVHGVLWEFDILEDRWVYVAPQVKEITGWMPDAWTNMQFWLDHLHPDDRKRASEYCMSCTARGESHEFDYRFMRPDGTFLWVRDVVNVEMHDGTPVRLQGLMIDITPQKHIEEKLKQHLKVESCIAEISSAFVRLTSEEVDDEITRALGLVGEILEVDRSYFFILDVETGVMNNTHEWCAPGIEPQIGNLQGLSIQLFPWWMERLQKFESVCTTKVAEMPPEASAEKNILEMQSIRSVLVIPVIWKNSLQGFLGFDSVVNEKVWVEEDTTLLNTLGDTFVHAIKRRDSERELLEEKNFIKSVLDELPIGIAVNTVEPLKLEYMNDKFPLIYHTTKKALSDPHKFWEVVYDDAVLREELKRKFLEDCASGKSDRMCWTDVPITRGGETFYITARNIPLPERDIMISTVWDVTDQKKVEDALLTSVREKDVLIREVHHRVKNNLQIISSLLRLQASQIEDENVLRMFNESGERIRSIALVHEKLYNTEDLSDLDFTSYARELVEHLFRAYGVNTDQIRFELKADEISLSVDEAIPMALVLNEIISNSLKHAFPDGRCGTISLKLKEEEKGFSMDIADDGIGIPENVQPDNISSLGLPLIYSLSNQLGGDLKLIRENGTRFTFILVRKCPSRRDQYDT